MRKNRRKKSLPEDSDTVAPGKFVFDLLVWLFLCLHRCVRQFLAFLNRACYETWMSKSDELSSNLKILEASSSILLSSSSRFCFCVFCFQFSFGFLEVRKWKVEFDGRWLLEEVNSVKRNGSGNFRNLGSFCFGCWRWVLIESSGEDCRFFLRLLWVFGYEVRGEVWGFVFYCDEGFCCKKRSGSSKSLRVMNFYY